MRWSVLFSLTLFLSFGACTKKDPAPISSQPVVEEDKDLSHIPVTIDSRILDTGTNPCDDFYQYSCGTWIKRTEIPAGYPRWARSFNTLEEDNQKTIKQVVENYSAGKMEPPTPFATKVGDYFSACMDTDRIEAKTDNFVQIQMARVDNISSKENIVPILGGYHSRGISAFFTLYSDQDKKDARRVIGVIDRGSLGLPDRDYYTKTDEDSVQLRKAYTEHVSRTLLLAKVLPDKAKADAAAAAILAFETKLAEKMLTITERRDPMKIYHLVGLEGLKQLAPNSNWDLFFESSGYPDLKQLNVTEPEYFRFLDQALAAESFENLKVYLKWRTLVAYSPYLGKAYVDENFSFYGKALLGSQEQLPRWKTCLEATDGALGEAVGEAYVKLRFSEESRTRAKELIGYLRDAVAENFSAVGWMDNPTRVMAHTKLQTMTSKLGYPETFRDYSGLDIDRDSYIENAVRASAFERRRDLAKIGKPVDKSEWGMVPHMVNAYYNPPLNEIAFPAAILQPPFFHLTAPLASNYGGIMMVIGHEITHGFDDKGRLYDELGNLRDWWTMPVSEAFKGKAECLVKQYDGYTVADGTVHLNGKNTLGENIADLGGLKLSWAAYQKAKKGKTEAEIAGLNGDKQFFVAFAQGWCQKATIEFEKYHAKTNVHAHPKYRVNGVVANLPAFQQTFGCNTGAPMAPRDRCEVW